MEKDFFFHFLQYKDWNGYTFPYGIFNKHLQKGLYELAYGWYLSIWNTVLESLGSYWEVEPSVNQAEFVHHCLSPSPNQFANTFNPFQWAVYVFGSREYKTVSLIMNYFKSKINSRKWIIILKNLFFSFF